MRPEVVQTTAPTVGSAYTITGTTPNGQLVAAIFGEGLSTNSNTAATMRFMMGFTDLRGSYSLSCAAEDATSGAGFASSLSLVNCISMINASGSSTQAPVAAFTSASGNNLNLTMSSTPMTARLTNTQLLSGVDIEAECGSQQFLSGATSHAQTYAHLHGAADVIIILTSLGQTGGDTGGSGLCIGYFDGSNMSSVSYTAVNAANPTDNTGFASISSTAEYIDAGSSPNFPHQTITSANSSGFTITLSADPGEASLVAWMALRGLNARMYAQAFLATLPNSLPAGGNQALVTGMSGPPQALLCNPGRITTFGSAQHNDQAGCLSLGMAANCATATIASAANAATFQYNVSASSVAKNKNSSGLALLTLADAGTAVVSATVNSWDAAGLTANYTAVNTSAVYCPGLAFGMPNASAYYLMVHPIYYNYNLAPTQSAYELDPSAIIYSTTLKNITFTATQSPNLAIQAIVYGYSLGNVILTENVFPISLPVTSANYSYTLGNVTFTYIVPVPPGTFPNVVGLPLQMAEVALQQAGALDPAALGYFGNWPISVVWQSVAAPAGTLMQPGYVTAQSPAPATAIVTNAPITLTVVEQPTSVSYPGTNPTINNPVP